MKNQPDDPGVLEAVDEQTDKILSRWLRSKYTPLWLLVFWLSGYAVGHFGAHALFVVFELFWGFG